MPARNFLDATNRWRRAAWAVGAVGIVCLAGCGPGVEMAPVEGRVLFNGEPLKFGSVMFQPPSGQPARAIIQADGSFRLDTTGLGDGAVVGRNLVRVTSFEAQNPDAQHGGAGGEGSFGRSLIPLRYNAYETSGLVVDVPSNNREPIVLELTD